MNIYDHMIENVKPIKPFIDVKGVLEDYKEYITKYGNEVVEQYKHYNSTVTQIQEKGFSDEYVKEFAVKELEGYEKALQKRFDYFLNLMKAELDKLKKDTGIKICDREAANSNLLKVQSVLPSMSLDDKKSLFECAAERDPNILEILYFNVKNADTAFAAIIKVQLDLYTGVDKIRTVEKHFKQLGGLYGYLTFNSIEIMQDGWTAQQNKDLTTSETVKKILQSYIDDMDKDINKLKQ